MNIAIVGATGFVGSHLVPHLAEAGHRVIAISRTGRRLPGWTDAVEARAADVTTGAGLDEALGGADAVVHLVAIPRESGGRRFEDVNVGGTRRVVEAAERAGIRRFVHLSVLGVVDDPEARLPAVEGARRAARPRELARLGRPASIAHVRRRRWLLQHREDDAALLVAGRRRHPRKRATRGSSRWRRTTWRSRSSDH